MELAFEQEWIREVCEKAEIAEERFGLVAAEKLQHRIADLLSADNPTELLVGNPRPLGNGTFAVDYTNDAAIEFIPNHANSRNQDPKEIDWQTVYRVRITSISSHGGES